MSAVLFDEEIFLKIRQGGFRNCSFSGRPPWGCTPRRAVYHHDYRSKYASRVRGIWTCVLTFHVILVLNTLPFGIGVAASTRVGNLIGSRSPIGAKHAAHASALLSVIAGVIVMTITIAFKDVRPISLSHAKTDNKQIPGIRAIVQRR